MSRHASTRHASTEGTMLYSAQTHTHNGIVKCFGDAEISIEL